MYSLSPLSVSAVEQSRVLRSRAANSRCRCAVSVEKNGVGDGRHDHADGVGAVSVEVAGQLVGNVVELAHRGLDFGTHIGRDVAGVVAHHRNGD